ncbi:MAG TPA: helicase [Candidatus Magasanikbacteria bacterium]|nr:helicase [Candidatus Magasanikbacteria bacterium]
MFNEIIFDIETENTFAEVNNDFKGLRASVVCLYHTGLDAYKHFTVDRFSEMWPLFESADRLIGYNSEHFDLPVLNNYYQGDLLKLPSLDILRVIKDSLGRRIKLDDVAQATLKVGKSADGLQAITWWKAGEKQKVIDYCMQDVKITKDIYEYGLKNKQLFYPTLTGTIQPFPVKFDAPVVQPKQNTATAGGVNLTLF